MMAADQSYGMSQIRTMSCRSQNKKMQLLSLHADTYLENNTDTSLMRVSSAFLRYASKIDADLHPTRAPYWDLACVPCMCPHRG